MSREAVEPVCSPPRRSSPKSAHSADSSPPLQLPKDVRRQAGGKSVPQAEPDAVPQAEPQAVPQAEPQA
jgi:hypothetical protein